jgi:hypothetical protein
MVVLVNFLFFLKKNILDEGGPLRILVKTFERKRCNSSLIETNQFREIRNSSLIR